LSAHVDRHESLGFFDAALISGGVTPAGSFFTIGALFRSTPHRLALAVAVAVGLALTIATFGGSGLDQPANASTAPLDRLRGRATSFSLIEAEGKTIDLRPIQR
jgi:hypothetical protein